MACFRANFTVFTYYCWAGVAYSVLRLATGWTVWGSNPGWGETFRTWPDRPWGLSSFLHNQYRVSFPGLKRPGRGANHPPPSSAEVKERIELYVYFRLWAFMACYRANFTFTFIFVAN